MIERVSGPLAPWRLPDVFVLYAGAAIGLTVLLLSWWGASGSLDLSTQVLWVGTGVGGLLVTGVCSTAWLLVGRRNVGLRQQALLGSWASAEPVAAAPREGAGATIVSAPGMTRYHRSDCLLVAGKDVEPLDGDRAAATGLRPCGVCRP